MTDDDINHGSRDFTTPEALKEHAKEIGSTMAYSAAEYIEDLHHLYAKALVELDRLRKADGKKPHPNAVGRLGLSGNIKVVPDES